jgi:hypothetical protein
MRRTVRRRSFTSAPKFSKSNASVRLASSFFNRQPPPQDVLQPSMQQYPRCSLTYKYLGTICQYLDVYFRAQKRRHCQEEEIRRPSMIFAKRVSYVIEATVHHQLGSAPKEAANVQDIPPYSSSKRKVPVRVFLARCASEGSCHPTK